MKIDLIDQVVNWFAADPMGPLCSVPMAVDRPPQMLRESLEAQLDLIPSDCVEAMKADETFQFLGPRLHSGGIDRSARTWVLVQALNYEIPRRRLVELQRIESSINTHPALRGVRPDDDGLVPLDGFEVWHGTLHRDGYAFTIVPQTESPNASYWLTLALRKLGPWKSARVRLDPFLHGPAGEFPEMMYKMWWWGTPLSWDDLKSRAGNEFGCWGPDHPDHGIQHTQYAWCTRQGEGHFELEELHTKDRLDTRGSRYFHAICDVGTKKVGHLDGAVRILTADEWDTRSQVHLKDVGKIGTRLKVFRLDEVVSDEALAALCSSYFVWNDDVREFFHAE